MTPADILRYLSPEEQAEALGKFLQIEDFDYSRMTRDEHDIVQLSHYTDLHDELVAKARENQLREREQTLPAHVHFAALPNHLAFDGTARVA